jgi:hypothetical protein
MAKEISHCNCIIDCSGLHEVASTMPTDTKFICLDALANGIIGVPAAVWSEFEELYADEAQQLEPHVLHKVRMTKKYRVGAASIADKNNVRFSRSPYDRHTDLYAASICLIEGHLLLTSATQLSYYKQLDCCKVSEVGSWANGQGT